MFFFKPQAPKICKMFDFLSVSVAVITFMEDEKSEIPKYMYINKKEMDNALGKAYQNSHFFAEWMVAIESILRRQIILNVSLSGTAPSGKLACLLAMLLTSSRLNMCRRCSITMPVSISKTSEIYLFLLRKLISFVVFSFPALRSDKFCGQFV